MALVSQFLEKGSFFQIPNNTQSAGASPSDCTSDFLALIQSTNQLQMLMRRGHSHYYQLASGPFHFRKWERG